ncbi:TolC family protein [Piscinibacter sakaiensis]|uniref:TolC family protein n=1 Tax=Piscinibacter sakaiensis TaxID=1547922 RepID=UPI003727BEC7
MPEARPFRSSPGPVALVAALILAGCAAVGPDHQRPAPALDASFIQPGSGQPDSRPVSADIAAFWRGFNDGPLTALVDAALAANGDVRIAQARLQEARAGLGEAEAAGRAGGAAADAAPRHQPRGPHRQHPRRQLHRQLGDRPVRRHPPRPRGCRRAGAGITWTPLDGGALRARVKGSEARAQQSLARFEQTLAVALEETEGAFSSFTRETQRAAKLDEAARQAETASQLARLRFEAGVTDFLAVLDAEREALQQRDALVQAQVGTAAALVAVYRSLGGGWAAPEGASGR